MNSASQMRFFLVLLVALQLLPIAAQGAAIEEVIVTAQKRDENIQDVGISISAFSAKQLEQLGIKNSIDVAQQVPGLHLFSFSPAFTVFSLRGVSQNNFQDNLEAPVAVTELPIHAGERFEVLADARDGNAFDLVTLPVDQPIMRLPPFDRPLPLVTIAPHGGDDA